MATQIIQNGVNIISLDDTKYVVNTYSENGILEIVNIVGVPFVVCKIYAGITHWIKPPAVAKINKTKISGADITLD